MIHYSCDGCGRDFESRDELRYIVKIETHAAMDLTGADDTDEDCDHLLEIHEILERMEDEQSDAIGEDIYRRDRYDLCPDCYRRFVKDPFGRQVGAHLHFSQN